MAFAELDPVVLDVDIPEHGLPRSSLGAVVHVHTDEVFEVEFVTASGRTAAVVTLKSSQIRKASDLDLICVSKIVRRPSPHRRQPRRRRPH